MSKLGDVLISVGRRLNDRGQEVPDPTPVAMPLGYKHPEPLEVRMARMIRNELSEAAARNGMESFEEANDFNVGEADDIPFRDEDDEFAANDPNLNRAFEEEEPVVREKVEKAVKEIRAKKENKGNKPKPKAAAAADDDNDVSAE